MEGEKVTESFNEWEQIQCPTSQSREWEMVAFGDNKNHIQVDLSIFPPSNHEGLQIPQPPPESQTTPGQPSSSAVCNVKAEEIAGADSRPKAVRNGIGKLLRSGGFWIASRVRYYVMYRVGFCSFASLTVLVAAVLLFSRLQRRRKWLREQRKDRLIHLINEKDQTIGQLLLQIAQLKEMLLGRRKVAVIRVG
ncbi:unnamed protein product [Dovyalis caffra]|uniref:Uncharacterized protein n=1 Tax=Dovyalis caffra TaxID=77055 RepID=A0AAV1QMY6_9ROSI|nr:unnamed protein product [Dovyalis caffra]